MCLGGLRDRASSSETGIAREKSLALSKSPSVEEIRRRAPDRPAASLETIVVRLAVRDHSALDATYASRNSAITSGRVARRAGT